MIGNLIVFEPKIYVENIDYKEEKDFIKRKVRSYISKISINEIKRLDILKNFDDLSSKTEKLYKTIKFNSIHILPFNANNNQLGILIFATASIKSAINEEDFVNIKLKYTNIKFIPLRIESKIIYLAQTETSLGIIKEFLEDKKESFEEYFDDFCVEDSTLPDDAKDFNHIGSDFYDYPAICFRVEKIDDFLRWFSKKSHKNVKIPPFSKWSYAATNGGINNYCWGDEEAKAISKQKRPENIFIDESEDTQIKKIKLYPKSKSGFYDLCGNVFELVTDEQGKLAIAGNSYSSYIVKSKNAIDNYNEEATSSLGIRFFYEEGF
jgi:hypothetical protein